MSKINTSYIPVYIDGYDSEYILRDYGNKIVVSVSIEYELEQHVKSFHDPIDLDYFRFMGENKTTIIEISDVNCITLTELINQ